ncbi:MAG: tripartite tricarboxylate transporter substrate binding protein [Betaproteobacteria bacterium]|nr:tripartite tricarboxylate transporter substrate binding protein [Betaproteobacteria bacterium]
MRQWCLAGVAALALAAPVAAQDYPTKPIRLLVPFAPGGSTDVAARILGAPVGQALGQNIVIDNRPGSGGLIATREAARANADGYTLLYASGAQMGIIPALQSKAGYDPIRDFAQVIHLTDTPLTLVVHPALAPANAKEFIAYTLANKGKVNAASTGNGTYTHLTIELFKSQTGADLTHVPYKGAAPAMNDLLGRQVQSLFTSAASAQPHIAAGRLKGLGVTATKRVRSLAEVPTFDEQGIAGLNVSVWVGIAAPAATPAPVVTRLAREFERALNQPDVRERLAGLGSEVNGQRGAPFTRMVREDVARWAKVVKAAGITAE